MKITDMGVVLATMQELIDLHLEHFFSAVDTDNTGLSPVQRCGTTTILSGYTEWMCIAEFPITIGWDWNVLTKGHSVQWLREELPRTNIQLLSEDGQVLAWEDSLRILAAWIDAKAWQKDVVQAVSVV